MSDSSTSSASSKANGLLVALLILLVLNLVATAVLATIVIVTPEPIAESPNPNSTRSSDASTSDSKVVSEPGTVTPAGNSIAIRRVQGTPPGIRQQSVSYQWYELAGQYFALRSTMSGVGGRSAAWFNIGGKQEYTVVEGDLLPVLAYDVKLVRVDNGAAIVEFESTRVSLPVASDRPYSFTNQDGTSEEPKDIVVVPDENEPVIDKDPLEKAQARARGDSSLPGGMFGDAADVVSKKSGTTATVENATEESKPYSGDWRIFVEEFRLTVTTDTTFRDSKFSQGVDGAEIVNMQDDPLNPSILATHFELGVFDVITKLNGIAVQNADQLLTLVKEQNFSERVSITYLRNAGLSNQSQKTINILYEEDK